MFHVKQFDNGRFFAHILSVPGGRGFFVTLKPPVLGRFKGHDMPGKTTSHPYGKTRQNRPKRQHCPRCGARTLEFPIDRRRNVQVYCPRCSFRVKNNIAGPGVAVPPVQVSQAGDLRDVRNTTTVPHRQTTVPVTMYRNSQHKTWNPTLAKAREQRPQYA